MIFTTEMLASYLGKDASILLGEPPFKNWDFEKSFEEDLDEPLIDYVCRNEGMDFVCDGDGRVNTIFLHSDELRSFKEEIRDLPFACSRDEVLLRFGSPSKSGRPVNNQALGRKYGAWDRFARPGYTVHVEYLLDNSAIKRITIMRADVVP